MTLDFVGVFLPPDSRVELSRSSAGRAPHAICSRRARVAGMASSCSLSEQPFDVLQLLGASLSQLLAPMHLTALVSTCSTLWRALAGTVQELKRDHRMVRAMLTRCGTTLGFVAGGPRGGLMWGGKSIDAVESRLIAQLVESGALSQVTWLSLGNNKLGDGGLGSIAVACRAGRLAQLKELSLSRNQLSDLALAGLAEAVCLTRLQPLCSRLQPCIPSLPSFACQVASGALDTLLTLRLSWNEIGDSGLSALARALQPTADCPAGALPRLRELSLNHNQIGEAGIAAFARTCEGGAAPLALLSELHLFNNALGSAGLAAWSTVRRAQGPSSAPGPSQGAPGGSGRPYTPRSRGRATRRPVTASAARASRLQSRLHCVPVAIQASRRSPVRAAAARGRRSASTTPRPYPSLAQNLSPDPNPDPVEWLSLPTSVSTSPCSIVTLLLYLAPGLSPMTPLTSPPQLAHLDMREIDAGDGGLVALAAAGTRGALAQLKHLDLRHNPFGNAGTGALADALSSNLAPIVAFASLARLYLQSGNARLRSAASDRRIELSGGIA